MREKFEPVLEQPKLLDIEIRDLFRYKFNYFEKDYLFYQHHNKFIPLDMDKFTQHKQKITTLKNPMLGFFLI